MTSWEDPNTRWLLAPACSFCSRSSLERHPPPRPARACGVVARAMRARDPLPPRGAESSAGFGRSPRARSASRQAWRGGSVSGCISPATGKALYCSHGNSGRSIWAGRQEAAVWLLAAPRRCGALCLEVQGLRGRSGPGSWGGAARRPREGSGSRVEAPEDRWRSLPGRQAGRRAEQQAGTTATGLSGGEAPKSRRAEPRTGQQGKPGPVPPSGERTSGGRRKAGGGRAGTGLAAASEGSSRWAVQQGWPGALQGTGREGSQLRAVTCRPHGEGWWAGRLPPPPTGVCAREPAQGAAWLLLLPAGLAVVGPPGPQRASRPLAKRLWGDRRQGQGGAFHPGSGVQLPPCAARKKCTTWREGGLFCRGAPQQGLQGSPALGQPLPRLGGGGAAGVVKIPACLPDSRPEQFQTCRQA